MKSAVIILIFLCFTMVFAQPPKATPVKLTDTFKRGKKVYAKVCLSCHQMDGGGVPKLNPPLIKTSYVSEDKSKLIYIVLNGMTDRIPIDNEYYSNNMASHKDLTDQEIADVLTFVRNSFGNNSSVVTIAEVKAVRWGLIDN